MSTNKRRRLDITETPKAMSAFALRKRLLNQQTSAPLPNPDPADEADIISTIQESVESSKPRSSKRAKKGPSIQQPAPGLENDSHPVPKDSALGSLLTANGVVSDSTGSLARSPSPTTDDEASEVPVKPVKALPIQLSNFKPSRSNYQKRKDGKIVLKLSDGERLVILGNYGIRVTSGEITVNGATLRHSDDKVHWVDAPHCHALPVIRCSSSATLELHPHPSDEGLRSLGKLFPQFRKLWNESNPSSKKSDSTFQILYSSKDCPKRTMLQDLVSPPEWNREIAELVIPSSSKPCSVMITGPKSSGKSTFGKILANRLITDRSSDSKHRAHRGVAVLDLDPGQPEYCVAGQVGLVLLTEPVFSPSFCRPLPGSEFRIVRSHAIASISPASDPELYLEVAIDLMTHYRNALGRYPLIINTPGWIQGTGLDLLTSLITSLRPTEVVYMSESGPAEAVEALRESCKTTGFSTLPSQASQITSRTAAHLRSMQTMSYFHAEPRSGEADENLVQWNPKPLTTVPPWQVSYSGPNRGIFGIMCYDYQAPLDLLADGINGTILAAVAVESTKAFRYSEGLSSDATDMMDIDDDDNDNAQKPPPSSFSRIAEKMITTTPEGIPFIDTVNGTTLDPRYSHSLSLVLVRGIDVENSSLQLLTPLSSESIEEVTSKGGEIVLVSGKFDTPSWAYTEELHYRRHGETDDGNDPDESTEAAEDSADDVSNTENDDLAGDAGATQVPWVEVLHGNQKRGAGYKVWRVRRDLGRAGNAT
ncbi:hypothetical protein F4677DRAFT_453709 [Hypoxylon crocopeplum]|nr:hypothetical protein F4677DRAFT_453709 [Hypoxylon crocopeplum]